MQGVDSRWQAHAVSLGGNSANAKITVHVPKDRWILWVSGPTFGPAELFWGVRGVLVPEAVILGRVGSSRLPVGCPTWLLLGVSLTQVSVFALVLVAARFFGIHYRSSLTLGEAIDHKAKFNLVQSGIVGLTLATASVLLGAAQNALLGHPATLIQGNQSSCYLLNWYQDRMPGEYSQASVFSVPL